MQKQMQAISDDESWLQPSISQGSSVAKCAQVPGKDTTLDWLNPPISKGLSKVPKLAKVSKTVAEDWDWLQPPIQ